jgi:hypothetical protein
MVHLQKFHERFAREGVLVFVISMLGDVEKARNLNDELAVTYPVFQGSGSVLGRLYAYG